MVRILHTVLGMPPFSSLLKKNQAPSPPSSSSELLLRPAEFGLGKLPRNLETDGVTTSVCGFCSTGCQLKLHLHEGQAIGLTPSTDYPVNLGMACPKSWEALSVLDSEERAASAPSSKSATPPAKPSPTSPSPSSQAAAPPPNGTPTPANPATRPAR